MRAPPTALRRGAVALVLLALVGVAGGGWHFSNLLVRPHPNRPLEGDLAVAAVDESTVTLSGSQVARAGRVWFLEWPGGSGVAGEIVATDARRVTRRFRGLEGALAAGDRVDLRAYPHLGDPRRTLGLDYEATVLPTELGSFPAWSVPGTRATLVVFVHGKNATRGEALRLLPVLVEGGYPSLTISYRNDLGAPASPDRLSHLGATEWRDLEDFVRMASHLHGSRQIVLVGFSMGGAVVAEFLRRSPLAGRVAGVVLDAPVLDWHAVVERGARREGGLAPLLAPVATAIVTMRIGPAWRESGPRAWPTQFARSVPVLLFHGTADGTVPMATSEAFAAALGPRVTLVRTAGAGHAQSWNFDPARYEETLLRWLDGVDRGGLPGGS